MRATTNGRRYGLSKPLSLSAFMRGRDGLLELHQLRRRASARTSSALASGLARNASTRFKTGWYAPPAKRPFFS